MSHRQAHVRSPLEGPVKGSLHQGFGITVHTSPLHYTSSGGSVLTRCSPPERHLGRSSGRTPGSRYGHMLPTRRDSGRPSRASPPRMPLPKLSPSSVGHRSGSPNVRGRILTNPSIPALGNGSDRGRTFSLAPVEGSSSTECEGDAWLSHAAAQGEWHHPHGSSCSVRVQRGLDTWEASAAASPPGQSGQVTPSAAGRASQWCDRQRPPGPHRACPLVARGVHATLSPSVEP